MRKGKRGGRGVLPPHSSLLLLAGVLLLVGMTAILAPVLQMEREIREDAEAYSQLKARIAEPEYEGNTPILQDASGTPAASVAEATLGTLPAGVQRHQTGADLAACKAQNSDFVAWLQIPGQIDYPVVSTDNTEYYLNHTFTGKKSYLGTLFSLTKTDYQTPSQNIAIYGHHIRSNRQVMFSPLLQYKDADFYEGHEVIYLDSLFHSATYRIFAAVNMVLGEWEPSTASFASQEDFLAFLLRARAQALYDTGVPVDADDEILTLITCDRSYSDPDGRLVVMAVKEK